MYNTVTEIKQEHIFGMIIVINKAECIKTEIFCTRKIY